MHIYFEFSFKDYPKKVIKLFFLQRDYFVFDCYMYIQL